MKTFKSFRNQTQINELFGLGKKKLTLDQHLKHLSDAAHSASKHAHNSSEDAWSDAPDTSFVTTDPQHEAHRAEVLKTHKKLYGPVGEKRTVDPEQARSNHRQARAAHAKASVMHMDAAKAAAEVGHHDLAAEHLQHAQHHNEHAIKHDYEAERVQAHYPW
jgi:hypothetical protein